MFQPRRDPAPRNERTSWFPAGPARSGPPGDAGADPLGPVDPDPRAGGALERAALERAALERASPGRGGAERAAARRDGTSTGGFPAWRGPARAGDDAPAPGYDGASRPRAADPYPPGHAGATGRPGERRPADPDWDDPVPVGVRGFGVPPGGLAEQAQPAVGDGRGAAEDGGLADGYPPSGGVHVDPARRAAPHEGADRGDGEDPVPRERAADRAVDARRLPSLGPGAGQGGWTATSWSTPAGSTGGGARPGWGAQDQPAVPAVAGYGDGGYTEEAYGRDDGSVPAGYREDVDGTMTANAEGDPRYRADADQSGPLARGGPSRPFALPGAGRRDDPEELDDQTRQPAADPARGSAGYGGGTYGTGYAEPRYAEPAYGEPAYPQAQYGQGRYAGSGYAEPEPAEAGHAESAQPDAGRAPEAYADTPYADAPYADTAYPGPPRPDRSYGEPSRAGDGYPGAPDDRFVAGGGHPPDDAYPPDGGYAPEGGYGPDGGFGADGGFAPESGYAPAEDGFAAGDELTADATEQDRAFPAARAGGPGGLGPVTADDLAGEEPAPAAVAAVDDPAADAAPQPGQAAGPEGDGDEVLGLSAAEDGIAGPLGAVQAVALERLAGRLDELIRLRHHDAELVDRLHAENSRLRAGELTEAMAPLLRGLIRLHDQMGSLGADDPQSVAGILRKQLLQVLDFAVDVRPYTAVPGGTFDPARHLGVRRVPTDDPSRDGTIARTVRPGFVRGETTVVRPAETEVYRAR
ncbi:putative Molecular chaperone GrpE (Heat shock protein) [Frankia canadensis]|uniref:Putative Molecular chaperone GrpE (Heat shock protein) n=1 Tax=Frankia canadensis TaxID=1836972 RepID=A0A2I2KK03_9ACTN|nr:hypothetical protein [Frankia canadensis]SNQ45998.1 putative Molecular chaperone GrpE (Heat shock protein) [Frankia canadensis]SOU53288.1 putative Molecular chaperone GrpE (Heat shock protein) [Frankia canadensis]